MLDLLEPSECVHLLSVWMLLACNYKEWTTEMQGRGENTHAYTHSLQNDHHVFLNIATKKWALIIPLILDSIAFPTTTRLPTRIWMTSEQPSILSSRKVIILESIESSGFEPARQEQDVLSRPIGGRISPGHDGDERAWQGRLHQRRGASTLPRCSHPRLLPHSLQLCLFQESPGAFLRHADAQALVAHPLQRARLPPRSITIPAP